MIYFVLLLLFDASNIKLAARTTMDHQWMILIERMMIGFHSRSLSKSPGMCISPARCQLTSFSCAVSAPPSISANESSILLLLHDGCMEIHQRSFIQGMLAEVLPNMWREATVTFD
jgi:hypothetical protein